MAGENIYAGSSYSISQIFDSVPREWYDEVSRKLHLTDTSLVVRYLSKSRLNVGFLYEPVRNYTKATREV